MGDGGPQEATARTWTIVPAPDIRRPDLHSYGPPIRQKEDWRVS
jgi:hypothetical protein